MPFNFNVPTTESDASVTIQSDALRKFLKLAVSVIPNKTSVSVIENIRIVADKGKGYLLATDLSNYVCMDISAAGMGKIDLIVKCIAVNALVAKMGNGPIYIERKGDMLTFKSTGALCFEIPGKAGIDFPIQKPLGKEKFSLSWTPDAVDYVQANLLPVCTDDPAIPALAGVMVSTDGTDCGFLSTNRHILVSMGNIYDNRFTVPSAMFTTLSLAKFMHPISVSMREFGVAASCGGITVYSEYIKGSFPETIEKLIPTEFKYKYRLRVGKLKSHVDKMVELATSPKESAVPLAVFFRPDTFCVDMMNVDCTDADTCGEDMWMRMDARMWQVALARFNDAVEITAGFNNNNTTTTWKDSRATTLVMPLMPNR